MTREWADDDMPQGQYRLVFKCNFGVASYQEGIHTNCTAGDLLDLIAYYLKHHDAPETSVNMSIGKEARRE